MTDNLSSTQYICFSGTVVRVSGIVQKTTTPLLDSAHLSIYILDFNMNRYKQGAKSIR
jgi:hypothetical protein